MIIQTHLFPLPPPCDSAVSLGARGRRRADGRGRHENSLAVRADAAAAARLSGRRALIAEWVAAHGPATDREIARGLFGAGADMNLVRPRVSELLAAGVMREAGCVCDSETGARVRRVEMQNRFEEVVE